MSSHSIGLTGIIGSGKSIVAEFFCKLGIDIVDTDIIARKLTSVDGAALQKIRDVFGVEYLSHNGTFNRKKMRQVVFSDAIARKALEDILHPLVYTEVITEIAKSESLYVIVVVPLLFKAPEYLQLITRSIFVDCDSEDELIRRVMRRSNLTANEVCNIIQLQVMRDTQLTLADDIIHNGATTTLQALCQQVEILHQHYWQIFT